MSGWNYPPAKPPSVHRPPATLAPRPDAPRWKDAEEALVEVEREWPGCPRNAECEAFRERRRECAGCPGSPPTAAFAFIREERAYLAADAARARAAEARIRAATGVFCFACGKEIVPGDLAEPVRCGVCEEKRDEVRASIASWLAAHPIPSSAHVGEMYQLLVGVCR